MTMKMTPEHKYGIKLYRVMEMIKESTLIHFYYDIHTFDPGETEILEAEEKIILTAENKVEIFIALCVREILYPVDPKDVPDLYPDGERKFRLNEDAFDTLLAALQVQLGITEDKDIHRNARFRYDPESCVLHRDGYQEVLIFKGDTKESDLLSVAFRKEFGERIESGEDGLSEEWRPIYDTVVRINEKVHDRFKIGGLFLADYPAKYTKRVIE